MCTNRSSLIVVSRMTPDQSLLTPSHIHFRFCDICSGGRYSAHFIISVGMGPLLLLLLGPVSSELLRARDLLAPALSPSALLGPLSSHPHTHTPRNQSATSGDLSLALSTMHFHRSMMNEFLCHNYLADEILTELRPLEQRSGEPARDKGQRMRSEEDDDGLGPPLLSDPGSKAYSEWLDKSAKLQKMYGQTAGGGKAPDQMGYETGHVTGYATVQTVPSYAPPPEAGGGWGSSGGGGGWSSGAGWTDAGGWSSGASNHGPGSGSGWSGNGNNGWLGDTGYGVSGGGWEEHETGKGLALKELFDLALTALAFLAFGLFIINLIMTCFAKTPNLNVMLPSTTESTIRGKRETASQLNELAYRVLTSVDKLLELQEQPDLTQNTCLEYTLCNNNKYSRELNDRNKIWLPVWSLGVSWVADGRRALDRVRASVLGLGGADCAAIYHQCSSSSPVNTTQKPSTRH